VSLVTVFLDRDGTINEDVGYIHKLEDLQLYPWAATAIKQLNTIGVRIIIVTNQSGVARGYFPETMVMAVNERLRDLLAEQGAYVDAIYYCPHHPTIGEPPYGQECNCRKPATGLIERAEQDYSGIDRGNIFVVGDKYTDVALAHAVGGQGVLLLTGHGEAEYSAQHRVWPQAPDYIAANLLIAVEWILSQIAARNS
jgi:D-glycero-D-manno-heptose 1,7-bisphosphate phosphatase